MSDFYCCTLNDLWLGYTEYGMGLCAQSSNFCRVKGFVKLKMFINGFDGSVLWTTVSIKIFTKVTFTGKIWNSNSVGLTQSSQSRVAIF